MALIVQKYGGTSVGDLERIETVANRVKATREAGNDVVVVLSAIVTAVYFLSAGFAPWVAPYNPFDPAAEDANRLVRGGS